MATRTTRTPEHRPTAEVVFTRRDGAQLVLLRGNVLERAHRDAEWQRLVVLEGSPGYRRRRLLAIAESRGYLPRETDRGTATPPPPEASGPIVRGQLAPTDGPRVHVVAEAVPGGTWRVRREHGEEPWRSAPALEEALAHALGLSEDDAAVAALAERLRRRVQA